MKIEVTLNESQMEELTEMIADRVAELMNKPAKFLYSTKEVADLFHTYPQKVNGWRRAGLIKGIRKGAEFVYRAEEVERFSREMEGKDIASKEKADAVGGQSAN